MTPFRVCVFCGSKSGRDQVYRETAEQLGKLLVARGLRLVYGGGSVGLMGVIADAVLAAGGQVTGVIPRMLATKELLHTGVQNMHVTDSMHSRKARMEELSDAFVALPGGFGTLEELLEIITWAQLGIHKKPVGILNVAGYFDPFIQLIDHAIVQGFIKPKHRQLIVCASDPASLLDELVRYRVVAEPPLLRLDEI
jgi:uncharacterized protein (TIGR00730 family)